MSKPIFKSLINHRIQLLNTFLEKEDVDTSTAKSAFDGLDHQLFFFNRIDEFVTAIPELQYDEEKTLAESAQESVKVYFEYPIHPGVIRYYEIEMYHEGSTFYIRAHNQKPAVTTALDTLSEIGFLDEKTPDLNTNTQLYQPQTVHTSIRKIKEDIKQYSHPKYYSDINYIVFIKKTHLYHDVPKYPKLQGKKFKYGSHKYNLQWEKTKLYNIEFTCYYLYNIKKKKVISIAYNEDFAGTQFEKHFHIDHLFNYSNQKYKAEEYQKVLFEPTHVVKTYTKFLSLNNLTKDDVYIDRDNDVYSNTFKVPSLIDWQKIISQYR
jgi:hypothetical protein